MATHCFQPVSIAFPDMTTGFSERTTDVTV
jgi:hypothetical protein